MLTGVCTEHAKGLAWAQWYIYSQVYEAPILDHPSFCMNNNVIFKRKLYFPWSQQAAFPWSVEPAGSSFPTTSSRSGWYLLQGSLLPVITQLR